MKKKAFVLLIFAMLAVTLSSCAASFPKKEHIATLSREKAVEVLKDKTEKEIHDSWGDPDDTLSGFYGDVYAYRDKHIVIYYDGDSKVTDVLVDDS